MNSHKNGMFAHASLAMEFSTKTLSQKKAKPNDLRTVLGSLKAVQWSEEIIPRIGRNPINKLPQRLRGEGISTIEYETLSGMLTGPITADILPIELWAIWGELILKYDLYKAAPNIELRTAATLLCHGAIKTPLDLSEIDKKQAISLGQSFSPGAQSPSFGNVLDANSNTPATQRPNTSTGTPTRSRA